MKNCRITITTTIDGVSTEAVRQGQAELSLLSAKIDYLEAQAKVRIALEDGKLQIYREGDYTQALYFQEGQILEGKLGIGGADGVIFTKTNRLSYSLSDTSLLLSLHYDLLIGDEPQSVQIRLFVKFL